MSNSVNRYLPFPDGSALVLDSNGNWTFFDKNGTAQFTILQTGKVGVGLPQIKAQYSQSGKTAAVTNAINYTPPASAGTYRLSAYVDVTAWTTPASFTIACTFKNAEGTAKTVTMATNEDDGTASAVIDEVSGFAAVPFLFGIDNSATAITLSTTGTFTGSPVYDLFAILEQFT